MAHEGAGILLFAKPTGRMLFMLREDGTWGIPGGLRDFDDATTLDVMLRELTEETGYDGAVLMRSKQPATVVHILPSGIMMTGLTNLNQPDRDWKFRYLIYVGWVKEEFEPELDDEHRTYLWAYPSAAPHPLHRGVSVALRELRIA